MSTGITQGAGQGTLQMAVAKFTSKFTLGNRVVDTGTADDEVVPKNTLQETSSVPMSPESWDTSEEEPSGNQTQICYQSGYEWLEVLYNETHSGTHYNFTGNFSRGEAVIYCVACCNGFHGSGDFEIGGSHPQHRKLEIYEYKKSIYVSLEDIVRLGVHAHDVQCFRWNAPGFHDAGLFVFLHSTLGQASTSRADEMPSKCCARCHSKLEFLTYARLNSRFCSLICKTQSEDPGNPRSKILLIPATPAATPPQKLKRSRSESPSRSGSRSRSESLSSSS